MTAALLVHTLAAVTFDAAFEGGALGKVQMVAENHYRVGVPGEADQQKRNRQASWYYFRVSDAKAKPLTLDLVDLVGEYNFNPGAHAVTKNTRPVYSTDGENWTHFTAVEWNDEKKELRLRLTPVADRLFIAHTFPYTNEHLRKLLLAIRPHQRVTVETIGRTAGNRPLSLVTLNGGLKDKPVIWVMARQHSWESGTSILLDAMLRWLLTPEGAATRDRAVWKILPLCDPDGVARGGVRYNVNGYDLNRNWDAVDPALMPEIAAQRKAILAWLDQGGKIDFFLTLHNQENHDHVEGPLSLGGERFRALGEGLYRGLKQETSFWSKLAGPRDMPATTTAGVKGRMNVVQGLFAERRVPGFLLETSVEPVESLGRPRTWRDWEEFGRGLARVLASLP